MVGDFCGTQVFLLSIDQPGFGDSLEKEFHLLSRQDLHRMARISHTATRNLFVGSRILLRKLLGLRLNREPASLEIQYTRFGKPCIENSMALEFNISHSGSQIALSISNRAPVGVDLEFAKPGRRLAAIAQRYFTPGEIQFLAAAKNQQAAFQLIWTLKEAYSKATGRGLQEGFAQFEFQLGESILLRNKETAIDEATFFSYRLPEHYFMSLCVLEQQTPAPVVFSVNADFGSREIELPSVLPRVG